MKNEVRKGRTKESKEEYNARLTVEQTLMNEMWTISLQAGVKEIIYPCRNAFVPIIMIVIENCLLMARMFCNPAFVDRVLHELGECFRLRTFVLFSPSFLVRMFRMVYGRGGSVPTTNEQMLTFCALSYRPPLSRRAMREQHFRKCIQVRCRLEQTFRCRAKCAMLEISL